jgi:TPP-dependent 2-oxoacid decarboxylase
MKTKTLKKTTGGYLLDSLYRLGAEHIFGVPGDYVLPFNKCIEQHKIGFINATRETTAGYMADAYARFRGLGIACITYGVGINIVNAMAQALVESSPLVVISGAPGSLELSKGVRLHHVLHPSFQMDLFKQVTIRQVILDDPKNAQEKIDQVLSLCIREKKPVYIELPRDMVDAPIAIDKSAKEKKSGKSLAEELEVALQDAEEILKKSRQPVIWIGHEIQRAGLSSFVVKFAESNHIPIVSSLFGKTAVDEHHPLFLGVYIGDMSRPEVSQFMESCDTVLMLGLMLTDLDTGLFTAKLNYKNTIVASLEKIKIGKKSFNHLFFSDFVKGLASRNIGKSFSPIKITKQMGTISVSSAKLTTKRAFECLQSFLTPKEIIVADVGDCLFGSADLILGQDSFIASTHFGSLGFGIPGAIGAQLAVPKRRVVGLIGDGAFQMTCTELSTAVRYGIDPIIIVFNNHGYATERPIIEGCYNDIQNWDYAALPKVLKGGVGIKVQTERDLSEALQKAFKTRGVFHLIEIDLNKTDFSPAMKRFGRLQKKE